VLIDDLPLFGAVRPAPVQESEVDAMLESISPDELSPREALALLYELKRKL